MPTQFIGTWTETEIYANDYWGGPFYWKNANRNIKVTFTANDKYYEKAFDSVSFTLIGTYKTISDDKVEITPVTPASAFYLTYTLNFSFEEDGQLILGDFATEGVIRKKFRLEK